MIGGYTTPATYLTKLDSYDTVADSWDFSSKIPMDRAGGRFQAVAVGNKIYVPNGWFWTGAAYAATTTLRIYDIDANSWSKGTPSPDARYNTAAAVVGNKIYVMGGYNAFGSATSSVYEYDTQTTLWTRKANMPTAQALISAAVINTTIYLISDFYFYAYDTTTDTWSTKSSAPTTHGASGSSLWPTLSAAYGKIYAFNLPSKFVDIYDPVSDSWNISFVNNASRESTVAVTVSNAIYSLGGGITSNPTSTNTGLTIGQYNLYQKN